MKIEDPMVVANVLVGVGTAFLAAVLICHWFFPRYTSYLDREGEVIEVDSWTGQICRPMFSECPK